MILLQKSDDFNGSNGVQDANTSFQQKEQFCPEENRVFLAKIHFIKRGFYNKKAQFNPISDYLRYDSVL